jgi:signal transduction histidine kinase
MRAFYASDVVARIQSAPGTVQITEKYKDIDHAIPIPATLSIELGRMISSRDGNVRYAFISDLPFQGRKPYSLDAFETDALAELRRHPKETVSEVTGSVFDRQVRIATPIIMGQACVNCHNAHPQSPKTDWKVGDVRGIQEITVVQPIEANIFAFKYLLVYLVAAAAGGIALLLMQQRDQRELKLAKDKAEVALAGLQAAQAQLVTREKLASLGQLTAGIAHEIKNPLNFVNNFADLSADLVRELRGLLTGVKLDKETKAEVDDIGDMLEGNLGKVVEHGKRADSIVKNMLLHSREGIGERRAVDLNALVEESLNLAYHGARAEKPGFNVTLERSFDATIGAVELYPQEFIRVLINLIGNGFYASQQRKKAAEPGFEPALLVATKNLGDRVEIRVRDNGVGIPAEVKAKIFNPFFTTKPAGEGTGLGLSLSYDIVVKQHGGTLEVETEPGSFTEFVVRLPSGAAPQPQARRRK